MRRQAIETSITDLEQLILKLKQEQKEIEDMVCVKLNNDVKFLVSIINPYPTSDTWRLDF